MSKHMVEMLTTRDNPYSYFDDFDKWFEFDTANGYNCCGYLARIAAFSLSSSSSLNIFFSFFNLSFCI